MLQFFDFFGSQTGYLYNLLNVPPLFFHIGGNFRTAFHAAFSTSFQLCPFQCIVLDHDVAQVFIVSSSLML